MTRLVLAGTGGFGREVFSWAHAAASADGPWRDIVFIDDNPEALAAVKFPAVQIGSIADYKPADDDRVVVTIGVPEVKKRVQDLLAGRGSRLEYSTLSGHADVTGGAILEAGVFPGPGRSRA